jgi:hypothetical protein
MPLWTPEKGALSAVSSESASPPDLVHVAFAEGEKCLRLTSLTSTTKLVETLEQNSRKSPAMQRLRPTCSLCVVAKTVYYFSIFSLTSQPFI